MSFVQDSDGKRYVETNIGQSFFMEPTGPVKPFEAILDELAPDNETPEPLPVYNVFETVIDINRKRVKHGDPILRNVTWGAAHDTLNA